MKNKNVKLFVDIAILFVVILAAIEIFACLLKTVIQVSVKLLPVAIVVLAIVSVVLLVSHKKEEEKHE